MLRVIALAPWVLSRDGPPDARVAAGLRLGTGLVYEAGGDRSYAHIVSLPERVDPDASGTVQWLRLVH